jgi:hypothetical protein
MDWKCNNNNKQVEWILYLGFKKCEIFKVAH